MENDRSLTTISRSERQTFALAESLAAYCFPGTLFLLDGDLAAGKTVFAKGLGAGLSVREHIKSPTFTLLCPYSGRLPFYHFDAYRLGGSDDFFDSGFGEYVGTDGVTLIEWASIVRDGFDDEYIHIAIERDAADEDVRTLTLTAHGVRHEKLLKAWLSHEPVDL